MSFSADWRYPVLRAHCAGSCRGRCAAGVSVAGVLPVRRLASPVPDRHGTATTTATPCAAGGTRSGSRRRTGAAAAPASSRRRCPFCSAVSASSDSPTPSSRTSIQSLSWSRRAVMSMWPAPAFLATPCLIAFSTSGCSSSVGTQRVERLRLRCRTGRSADRRSGSARSRGTSSRKSSSALSVTSCCPRSLERHAGADR